MSERVTVPVMQALTAPHRAGRPSWLRRAVAGVLGAALAALLLTAQLPHQHHDGSASLDPAHACRVCKIHQSFSADLPRVSALQPQDVVTDVAPLTPQDSPRILFVLASAAPRAPPLAS